jgi:hypothetical protein
MLGMSNDVAVRLAPLSVLDDRGESVSLGRFWDTAPAVLGFVRHFG